MSTTVVPEVLWAQRSSADEPEKNIIYLSINAYDCDQNTIKLDIQPTKITFSGTSKARSFHVELELYGEIDVDKSKHNKSTRGVDFVLRKKEAKKEFWPRLLKESRKLHFLKTDFDKWVDEDEQEDAPAEDPMAGMGGGMGGMGGGEDGGFGGIDFSKLGGGMGGMGGMGGGMDMASMMSGMGGMGGMGGGSGGDDFDDEDMPELEGDSGEEPKAEGDVPKAEGAKIEDISDSK